MNEKTRFAPGSAEQQPGPAGKTEKPARLDQAMHTEIQTRRARGRLSREDQRRLGDVLQRVYDDVVKQGVPDRFKMLIDQLGQQGVLDSESESDREGQLVSSNGGARGSDKSEDESR